MIHVQPQPEPRIFHEKVRQRGAAFLVSGAPTTSDGWKAYWQDVSDELCDSYSSICAYSAFWTQDYTVDHYEPKSKAPHLAYEWSNYRLATPKMNSRKREHTDVVDPFTIEDDWFVLDFPSLLVKPNRVLIKEKKEAVAATIKRLQLNDDDYGLKYRVQWVLQYCESEELQTLRRFAPFVAYELERQGMLEHIAFVMGLQ